MRNLDNLIYRAEELGEVKIQYRLAVIYQTGDRVEQDLEQARHWFERAAENGHEEAARILATMGGKPVESKAPKVTKAKKRGDSKEKSTADDLPPLIQRKPRRQSLDIESGLEGTTDCPHGHGPLQDWQGNLRCWICGWTSEQPDLKKRLPAHSTVTQPEPATEPMRTSLRSQFAGLFGNKPSAETSAAESGKDKKPGIGCDAVWVVGGIIYLLAQSC